MELWRSHLAARSFGKGLSTVPLPQKGHKGRSAPLPGRLLALKKSPEQEAPCTLTLLHTAKFLLVKTDWKAKKGALQVHAKWDRLHQCQTKVSHDGQQQACGLLLCQYVFSLNAPSNKYFPGVWMLLSLLRAPSEHIHKGAVHGWPLPMYFPVPGDCSTDQGREDPIAASSVSSTPSNTINPLELRAYLRYH